MNEYGITDFIREIKGYYGPWKTLKTTDSHGEKKSVPYIQQTIIAYLKNDIQLNNLDILKKYIFYNHSLRYGPPGISDIEMAIDVAVKYRKGVNLRRVKIKKQKPQNIKDPFQKKEIANLFETNEVYIKLKNKMNADTERLRKGTIK